MNNQIKKKAFTLVELLMVLAIISIMMILFLPSLNPIKTETRKVGIKKNKENLENLVKAKTARLNVNGITEGDLLDKITNELLEEPSITNMTNPFDTSKKGLGLIIGDTYDETNKAAYLFTEDPIVDSLPRGTVFFRISPEEIASNGTGTESGNNGTTGGNGNQPTQAQATQFSISALSDNTVIQKNDNTYAFGINSYRQVTNAVTTTILNPTIITISETVKPKTIVMNNEYVIAIGDDGNLYSWGYNYYGQLGNGTTSDKSTPTLINLPNGVKPKSIASGNLHSLAIGDDGNLYAWGWNAYGQLGDGTTTNKTTPTIINLPNGVKPKSIAAGGIYSFVIGDDENLYAWGYNYYGDLGDGTTTHQSKPVLVNFPNDVKPTYVTAGYAHSLAIGSDGNLYSWGSNNYGQLGDGTKTNKSTPALVTLPNKVKPKSIVAGHNHTLMIGTDNNLYGWGRNHQGQLGTGDITEVTSPQIAYLPNKVKLTSVATGQSHTLATGADGNVYIWGQNSSGQLGTGDTLLRLSPIISKVITDLE